jgi:hypothetical protein
MGCSTTESRNRSEPPGIVVTLQARVKKIDTFADIFGTKTAEKHGIRFFAVPIQ